MAVIREQVATFEGCQRHRYREGPLVCERIVDGDLVLKDVVGHAAEPFGYLHLRAVAGTITVDTESGLVRQVRRFHDEIVAVPMGARIAEIFLDAAADVRTPVGVEVRVSGSISYDIATAPGDCTMRLPLP